MTNTPKREVETRLELHKETAEADRMKPTADQRGIDGLPIFDPGIRGQLDLIDAIVEAKQRGAKP